MKIKLFEDFKEGKTADVQKLLKSLDAAAKLAMGGDNSVEATYTLSIGKNDSLSFRLSADAYEILKKLLDEEKKNLLAKTS